MRSAENYKMKKSCPQWDSNSGPSAYKANALSIELLELMNIDHLKVTAFNLSFLSIVLLFDLLRRLLTVKSY